MEYVQRPECECRNGRLCCSRVWDHPQRERKTGNSNAGLLLASVIVSANRKVWRWLLWPGFRGRPHLSAAAFSVLPGDRAVPPSSAPVPRLTPWLRLRGSQTLDYVYLAPTREHHHHFECTLIAETLENTWKATPKSQGKLSYSTVLAALGWMWERHLAILIRLSEARKFSLKLLCRCFASAHGQLIKGRRPPVFQRPLGPSR